MIIPVTYSIRVFGDDSFDLSLTWKDSNGDIIPLAFRTGSMEFFVSDADRTNVKTVTTTPSAGGSVITLSNDAPNVTVLIVRGETGVGTTPDFTDIPGFYLLRLIIDSDLDDRLLMGRVRYRA